MQLNEEMRSDKIEFRRILKAPLSLVWAVITEKEHLKSWYFDFSDQFNLNIGNVFEWYAGPPDGRQWLHRGEMLELVPLQKLVYSWEYPGYAGKAKATWHLRELAPNVTELVFHFEALVPFDPNEEALKWDHFREGWSHIIETSLPEYLARQNA